MSPVFGGNHVILFLKFSGKRLAGWETAVEGHLRNCVVGADQLAEGKLKPYTGKERFIIYLGIFLEHSGEVGRGVAEFF